MEKEYKIKGIDKIIGAISKEDLARYFETDQNANFEALITESLKTRGVPSGLEVAGYESKNFEDMKKGMDGYLQDLCEKYIKDGKAAIGMNYPITHADMTELYFYVDEPVKDEDLYSILGAKTHLGGVLTLGHIMGKGFYEAHKDEIGKFQEEASKSWYDQRAFEDYVRDYFDRERERAQKEKERMAGAEQLISKLTGGKSIEDVTLQDLEQIKQGLIARQEKVKEAFAEKFGTKENEQEKE